ncbi:MAG: hypothetical protein AB8B63_12010 [Granulosicoccus sp.]
MSRIDKSTVITRALFSCVLWATVQACSEGVPGLGSASPVASKQASGMAAPLSDATFESLPVDEQYQSVNKLLATLYSGVSVADFYALDTGSALVHRRSDAPTLGSIRDRLQINLPATERKLLDQQIIGDDAALDAQGNAAPIEGLYRFDRNKPKQMPLARIFHYPLSRDMFSQWIAWHLANTILFSPAEELDSADLTDVQNLFRRLDLSIMAGESIRSMVAVHQHSVENWRRFRSPEDNTREMMEIYLGIFDNDEEVPLASQACQDLYLTDERDGYKLAYTDYPNSQPVLVLDRYVTNCRDFYDVIASHPLLIPRVVDVLVDYFFAGRSAEDRAGIAAAISASNPVTFEDIFVTILFSENYLLDTERARSFEESFLPMAKRLQWDAHADVFKGMISGSGSLGRANLSQMGWSSMTYKLGRVAAIPLDTLSFGNYHKALRESLMLDSNRWKWNLGVQAPQPPEPEPVPELPADASVRDATAHAEALQVYEQTLAEMTTESRQIYDVELAEYQQANKLYLQMNDLTVRQLIDYVFLGAVQRRADEIERGDLIQLLDSQSHLDAEFDNQFVREGRLDDVTLILMDYLSRLPELYFLNRMR